MDPLGLILSWFPVLLGELVVLSPIRNREVNLEDPRAFFLSRGVVLYVPFCLMSERVWKICAVLRTASVTISFKRIVRRACKVSTLPAVYSAIVWSIGGIETRMISGMSRLINSLCG